MRVSAFPGLLCRKSGNMSVVCVCTHLRFSVLTDVNADLYLSMYIWTSLYIHIENHEFTLMPPFLIQHQRFFLSFSHVFVTLFSYKGNLVSAAPLMDTLFIPLLSLLYQTLCRCLLTPGGLRSPSQITAPTPTGQLPCSPPT